MHPMLSVEMMRLEHAARVDRLRRTGTSSGTAPARRGRQTARGAMRRAANRGVR